ncbi:PadR family transcriptional regulator [Nocardioides gansuensis]|uniref:PadR family transcriptional regulator n=2 Tax=Nocardioides gansuensis TaxID=2138300 RepID=A0A2T8F995_9ACTN|nr:PadR family transcriptional regulator [Nocardioides gansuensis]
MLLLGAVALFEPVNGYQIRRELGSWQVDEWANLGPGSIYSGLNTLVKLGQVVRHDLEDDGRQVAVYEITGDGREELGRLLAESLERVTLFDRVGFHAAFGLIALLDRTAAIRHLEVRLEELDRMLAREPDDRYAPPHALWGLALELQQLGVERTWVMETVERLGRGDFTLAGDEWTWVPPADDPGHQIQADREKYRGLLGR